MPSNGIRGLFVGSDASIAERMRLRRWELMRARLPDLLEMTVVDLGGTMSWWARAPVRPRHVTVVNLAPSDATVPWVTSVAGDACQADILLAGQSFDLAFSNSLIEHVGGHRARSALARVIRSLAPRYLVQAPYRYFPLEPHWLFPGLQFAPLPVRRRVAALWPLGHTRGWDDSQILDEVMSTELFGATEMRAYFPDGRLYWERFLGLPKSMIVIR
jgi:Methyltransferase domain